ncbi:natural cytotoxicity triggering receptor 3-like [Scyliorhinus torazame]|uniref:natural cytotoxicity triggering receptor 3-like n=1 Tax=Scyliorhinus torazame TaxID=75743 RepID=UPI003B5C50F1
MEGEVFQIVCKFTASVRSRGYAINWYKQVLGRERCRVTNNSEEFIGRVLEKSDDSSKSDQITVIAAKQNDSGIYYCEIVLMGVGKGTGKGTRVTVNGQKQPDGTGSSLPRQLILMGVKLTGFAMSMSLLRYPLQIEKKPPQWASDSW